MSTDTPIVILGQKGDIRQAKLKGPEPKQIAAVLKKKEAPSLLGRYTCKQKTLFLFGYLEGKADTENQHHLPPPLEGLSFYGDICIIASTNPSSYTSSMTAFKTAEYETFYTQRLEGEEEDDEFDDEENEPEAEFQQPEEVDFDDGEEDEAEEELTVSDDQEDEEEQEEEDQEDE
jgi:hypothetical protein